MGQLTNQRHELFAQFLASGKTGDESYALAGYKPNRGNAARLKADESILTRVRELQERAQKANDVTLESLTDRYNTAIDRADKEGAHPAVMAGLAGLAKLHGLIVDKHKVEQGRLDDMSDDAIADDIEKRLADLAERRAKGAGQGSDGAGAPRAAEPDRELQSVSEASRISQTRD